MAAVSRPVIYLAVAGVAAVAFLLATKDDAPAPTAKAAPRRRVAKAGADWDFPAPDPSLRFDKPRNAPRNVFVPLAAEQKPLPVLREPIGKDDLVAIPAKLAGGEAAWAYTGMVEANGVRMALLENKAKNLSGYVREGEYWKKARVVGISSPCIVLADEKGVNETVYRFDPNAPPKPKAEPGPSFGPGGVGAPLVGPIAPGGSGFAVQPTFARNSNR